MEPVAGVDALPRPSAVLDAARDNNEFNIKNGFSAILLNSIV